MTNTSRGGQSQTSTTAQARAPRWRLLAHLLGVMALGGLSWSSAHPDIEALTPPLADARVEGTVVIVTIDGVRWQELFQGLDPARASSLPKDHPAELQIPELRALMRSEGAVVGSPRHGSDFRVAGPTYLSLPGYNQLFSGRAAVRCGSNHCARTKRETLFDAVSHEYGPASAVVIASWPELERAAVSDPQGALISAGRTRGPGRGTLSRRGLKRSLAAGEGVLPAPGLGDYRPDAYTFEVALDALERLHPRLLFVGLGDTDEYAHYNNYAGYVAALEHFDDWLGRMLTVGDELEAAGHPVTWFITTDHGRADGFFEHGGHPEASRTWLIAAGAGVSARGPLRSRRQLSDIAPTVAAMLGVPLDDATGSVMDELL